LCRAKPEGYKTRRAFIKHNAKNHPEAMRLRDRMNNDLDGVEYNSDEEDEEEEEEE
jgi:murein tripeptide amidase MpaA